MMWVYTRDFLFKVSLVHNPIVWYIIYFDVFFSFSQLVAVSMCTMLFVASWGSRLWPFRSVMDPHSRISSLPKKRRQQGEKDNQVLVQEKTHINFCNCSGCLVHSPFPWWCVLLSWRCQIVPSLIRPAVKMYRYIPPSLYNVPTQI